MKKTEEKTPIIIKKSVKNILSALKQRMEKIKNFVLVIFIPIFLYPKVNCTPVKTK